MIKIKKRKLKNTITTKAHNHNPIRVLYKKVGQDPEIKIINDTFRFKKAIVEKSLDIIPYKNHYIVCNSKEKTKANPPHIVFDYGNVTGDLIIVGIDKEAREFKGMSQEDIIWFSEDLIDKTFQDRPDNLSPTFPIREKQITKEGKERTTNICFEKTLINTLISIELILAGILKNKNRKKGETENEEMEWNK